MTFRFQRRIRIAPGIRVNLGKRGASLSVGPRGLSTTVGTRGVRRTVSLPGTGMSWSVKEPLPAKHRQHPVRGLFKSLLIILAGTLTGLFVAFLLIGALINLGR